MLFIAAWVEVGKAAYDAGFINGDQIVAVEGFCSDDVDGKQQAQKAMKQMTGKETEFVVRRGPLLEFLTVTSSRSKPAGLRVSDAEQFYDWAAKARHIAIVKSIQSNSPAEIAGLQTDDKIVW